MEDPRPRKKMLAGRQRIYGPDTVFSLPETEDVEDSKPRPMMLAAGQISGSADRGSWLPERFRESCLEQNISSPEAVRSICILNRVAMLYGCLFLLK